MTHQDGFDVARFDPVPADLDLPVRPTEEHEVPGGAALGEVTGQIGPLPAREGDEPLRGQPGVVQVAEGEVGAGDGQLAGTRGEVPVAVQQQVARVAHRPADAHRRRSGVGPVVDQGVAGADGRLGRAVLVHQGYRRQHPGVPFDQHGTPAFAADPDRHQTGRRPVGDAVQERPVHRCRVDQVRDVVLVDHRHGGGDVGEPARFDDQGAAGQHRPEQHAGAQVERR